MMIEEYLDNADNTFNVKRVITNNGRPVDSVPTFKVLSVKKLNCERDIYIVHGEFKQEGEYYGSRTIDTYHIKNTIEFYPALDETHVSHDFDVQLDHAVYPDEKNPKFIRQRVKKQEQLDLNF